MKEDKKKLAPKGISGTKPGNLLKKYIQDERKPWFFEIDMVHHCGERDALEFLL